MKKGITFIASVLIFLLAGCFFKTQENNSIEMKPEIKGQYIGETTNYPSYLNLEIKSDLSFTFAHIISLHTPPSKLEEFSGMLEYIADTQYSLNPPPKVIKANLRLLENGNFQATLKDGETSIELVKN